MSQSRLNTSIRGRFAPSPTGEMHLGNIWTALLAWLQIRSLGGVMVLRIEDLDPARSRKQYIKQLMDDLTWLGLDWDEGSDKGGRYAPYCQSERLHIYQQTLEQLANQGLVYPCCCTRAELHNPANAPHIGEQEFVYPRNCRLLTPEELATKMKNGRKPAQRLITPLGKISFTDGVFGHFSQDLSTTCGDFLIQRSDGVHAYQLAVVVDDSAMNITHIVRGADLLTSTPRQLWLYSLLGTPPPRFTHVPLLLGLDGHRLSKRQQDLSLSALRQKGITAEQIIGYLAYKAHLQDSTRPVAASQLIQVFSEDKLPRQAITIDATEIAQDTRLNHGV